MDPAMAIEVAAMSRQRALEKTTVKGDSDIQKFYRECTVFITGGSGFMGKQLIEKLLRSCQIGKIFVLLRQKKGKEIRERLNEMLQDPVFETLRKQQPDFEQTIVAIGGDAAELRLGISNKDWETITDQVDVIFHMAATTRFDEPLQVATVINVRGTREAIELGKSCKKLKSFVHVSTAYAQARGSFSDQEVYEQFYPTPIPPAALISMAEEMEQGVLNNLADNMIQDWPNTYTYTKAVAEELIRISTDGLPVTIVRPGVVIGSYREPTPGWLDTSCAFGASGMAIGVGLGLLRIMQCRTKATVGFVPCDFVNNAIIAAGKEATQGGQNSKIYVVSSIARNTITQGDLQSILIKSTSQLLSPKAVYYVSSFGVNNKYLFVFLSWLLHIIPGYILDFVCMLLGKEQRFVKLYKKIYKLTDTLGFFTTKSFLFVDKNLGDLYNGLSKTDKVIFNFDIPSINWQEYIQIWCIGIRKYIVKDGLKGTEEACRRQYWLRIVHYIVSSVYFFLIYKTICAVIYVIKGLLFFI